MVFRLLLVLVWLIPVVCRAEYTLDASPRTGVEIMRGRIESDAAGRWLSVAGIGRYKITAGRPLTAAEDGRQFVASVKYLGDGNLSLNSIADEPAPLSATEWEMMRHVNRARIANNRMPFRWSPSLMASARQHSATLGQSGAIGSHVSRWNLGMGRRECGGRSA